MPTVINWRPPKGVNDVESMRKYFAREGIFVDITQCHRVPNGKLNTTFDGPNQMLAWRHVKDLQSPARRLRRKTPMSNLFR